MVENETKQMTAFEIATICHEVNRAYCKALGDNSQAPWEEAPEWQKKSALNGVIMHLENPDAGPENSHESWLAEKRTAGWIYGPVKNEEQKTHPCCVEYSELPAEQQAKDFIFRQIVHSLKNFL
jgi:hypothetical protein